MTRSAFLFVLAGLVASGCGQATPAGSSDPASPDGGLSSDGGESLDGGGMSLDGGGGTDAGSDAGTSCDSRSGQPFTPCSGTTFAPDSPTEAWTHPVSTPLLVLSQGAPRHRGIDTIVNPGQEQVLIGKFAYGALDKDLKDEKVEIWAELACGQWQKLGAAQTSQDGQWGTVAGVVDDGGRIFFTVPVAARLGVGSHRVKMLVKGDHSEANFWLHVWPRGTHVIVSDIDGTISTQENDGLWAALDPASPTPRPFVAQTHQAYVAKGYRVIYLTARPEFMTEGTRGWFASHGFPMATLHLSQTNFGEQGQAALDYKKGFLDSIIQGQGVAVDWAYGNKVTDLDGYLGAGISPDRIYLIEGEYTGDMKGGTRLASYQPEPPRVACLPPVVQP